ncbi:tyrosine-protein phosphatase [Scatolibacter rhodanostii]|uniref:tyrosine-protein phosphatase n=1 Tax=Scatolibacter rhodanostii TaxID=2014781 RepID=UPI000C0862CE|nr:tyrosine-protein phosphatase [Scatolibacter rhodanostii]
MSQRRIILGDTDNTRDLGGYPIGKFGMTKYSVFWRSGVPKNLSKDNIEMLKRMRIITVIDLRAADELKRMPSCFVNRKDFSYYHLPIYANRTRGKPLEYFSMLSSPGMAKIFKIQAALLSGCLFHCRAGKDRTGVIAALLLLLAGVEDSDIIADYVMTYPYLAKRLEIIQEQNPDFPAYVIHSEPEYMQGFLSLFHRKYGTAERYLSLIGLTSREIKKLKTKLVD